MELLLEALREAWRLLLTGDGDVYEITLRTAQGTFGYEVSRVFVVPSAGSGRVLEQTSRPTLVLTTCNPKYSSAERLIVTARRVSAA